MVSVQDFLIIFPVQKKYYKDLIIHISVITQEKMIMLKVKIVEETTLLINADTEDACNFLDNRSISEVQSICKENKVPVMTESFWEIQAEGIGSESSALNLNQLRGAR